MALKQCSMCDRTFTKLEHLKRHERSRKLNVTVGGVHAGLMTALDTKERPYECPTCNKSFSRR